MAGGKCSWPGGNGGGHYLDIIRVIDPTFYNANSGGFRTSTLPNGHRFKWFELNAGGPDESISAFSTIPPGWDGTDPRIYMNFHYDSTTSDSTHDVHFHIYGWDDGDDMSAPAFPGVLNPGGAVIQINQLAGTTWHLYHGEADISPQGNPVAGRRYTIFVYRDDDESDNPGFHTINVRWPLA